MCWEHNWLWCWWYMLPWQQMLSTEWLHSKMCWCWSWDSSCCKWVASKKKPNPIMAFSVIVWLVMSVNAIPLTYPSEKGCFWRGVKLISPVSIVTTGKEKQECPFLNPTPLCDLPNGTCYTGDVTCPPGLICCLDNTCEAKCTQPALKDGKHSFVCWRWR